MYYLLALKFNHNIPYTYGTILAYLMCKGSLNQVWLKMSTWWQAFVEQHT